MSNFKKDLNRCKEYNDVMERIIELLEKKSIIHTRERSNEIVITGKTKDEVYSLLRDLPIPSIVLQLMLEVSFAKGSVHIRKKIK